MRKNYQKQKEYISSDEKHLMPWSARKKYKCKENSKAEQIESCVFLPRAFST